MIFDEDEREKYIQHLEYTMIQQCQIESAEEKGMERGMEKSKVEIVLKSLTEGIDVKTISLITGLTEKEIQIIKDANK